MNLIGVALHCHWKQSQHGTVLKIAPCWQLTGSVYTAIIKAVQVMSVCDLKGGTSSTTSHNIYSSWRRFMVTSSVGKRSTQEGTKTHGMQLQSRDIAHCHTFLGLIRTSSVLCTHRCSTDLAWYRLHWQVRRCQAELVPCQLALTKQAGPCWYCASTVSSGSVNAVLE